MGLYALTGGATGIGAGIRAKLESIGHQVLVADIKDGDIPADLSRPAGRQKAIAAFRDAAGDGLDGLVTSAGVASQCPDRKLIASLNYFGTTEIVDGLSDLLRPGSGSIVLISSNSAPQCQHPEFMNALLEGNEDEARRLASSMEGHQVYSGSKQAVARWMRRRSTALAKSGLTINAIAPGYTQTPMTDATHNDPTYGPAIQKFVQSIPVGRPGEVADIADMAEYLLSDKARFICGSVVFVDGGHDAMFRPDTI